MALGAVLHRMQGYLDMHTVRLSTKPRLGRCSQVEAYHQGMGNGVIPSDPGIQGGVPVFVGTRVPVKNLFDYLEAGDSLKDFLRSFPSVTREQAVAALELARAALASDAHTV
jgi:uncharacterized protein (DUF433 family)